MFHRATSSSTSSSLISPPHVIGPIAKSHHPPRNNGPPYKKVSSMIRLIQMMFVLIVMMGLVGTWYYVSSTIFLSSRTATTATTTNHDLDHDEMIILNITKYLLKPKTMNHLNEIITSIRTEYKERYGAMADRMYENGVYHYGNTIQETSHRILRTVLIQRTDFVLSFAGYSVTVGRGNFYNQSYPFVLQRILSPLFAQLYSAIDNGSSSHTSSKKNQLMVRNSAIGGIPSYPYGFCLNHFLGSDSNVISWDYSMNENGKDSSVLESYIRQSYNQLSDTRPMIIILDTNPTRCSLLKEYITNRYITDGICVGMAKDILKGTNYDQMAEGDKPIGLRNWEEFGAPPNCPGRSSWHPKKREHELIGWIMAMYFIHAMEHALHVIQHNPNNWWEFINDTNSNQRDIQFPKPLSLSSSSSTTIKNSDDIQHLLYGYPVSDSIYTMHDISCRTNFLPATDHDNVLSSIIVSGLAPTAKTDDIIIKRSDDMYDSGWVYDVSDVERKTKIEVNKCGGLGYIDMKIALYGVSSSGVLRLWLPYESSNGHNDSFEAIHYFTNIIICEANEKRSKDACQLDRHIQYTVGNVIVPSDHIKMIAGAGEYLQRKTCVHIQIPTNAEMIFYKDITSHPSQQQEQRHLLVASGKKYHIGIMVDIQIMYPNITRSNGACCISHVVWEHIQ